MVGGGGGRGWGNVQDNDKYGGGKNEEKRKTAREWGGSEAIQLKGCASI